MMIVNNKVENMRKEKRVAKFNVISGQFPGVTEEYRENPQDISISGRDSIRATSVYKTEILLLERNYSEVAIL
jgi:hypothetical protein